MSPAAAFVLVSPAAGELVAVSRDEGGWGLPGGMVEAGEMPGVAAVRELWEETGLTVERLTPVFEGQNEKGLPVRIFWASGKLTGPMRSSEEGVAAVVGVERLLQSRYHDTIRKALVRAAQLRRAGRI